MTMHIHCSPELDARSRGEALGRSWRPEIQASWQGYLRLFTAGGADLAKVRDLGSQAVEEITAWAPGLWDEVAGVAAGAQLEPWQAAALNARTELLAHLRPADSGECSTSVYLPGAGEPPRTIQTWDWYDHLRGVKLAWLYAPRPGHHVRTFTEFGVLGKIGVNSAGLGVHFNLLQHVDDGDGVGVPIHLVARRILDEASTTAEAVEIARSARVTASTVITIVTYDGDRSDACAIELSPAGTAVLPAAVDGTLTHTNHFLDPGLAAGERLGPVDPDTYARQKQLELRQDGLRSADPTRRAQSLLCHAVDGAGLCCHPDPQAPEGQRWETLLVICLDLAAGRLQFHDGSPCTLTPTSWTVF
jgi:isopenicillin-N N-acyltransferase-like protein